MSGIKVYRVREAAELLGITKQDVRDHLESGALQGCVIDGERYVVLTLGAVSDSQVGAPEMRSALDAGRNQLAVIETLVEQQVEFLLGLNSRVDVIQDQLQSVQSRIARLEAGAQREPAVPDAAGKPTGFARAATAPEPTTVVMPPEVTRTESLHVVVERRRDDAGAAGQSGQPDEIDEGAPLDGSEAAPDHAPRGPFRVFRPAVVGVCLLALLATAPFVSSHLPNQQSPAVAAIRSPSPRVLTPPATTVPIRDHGPEYVPPHDKMVPTPVSRKPSHHRMKRRRHR